MIRLYPVRGNLAHYDLAAVRRAAVGRRREAVGIRLAREARGLTVGDLATALGVDRRTLGRWEEGSGRGPSMLHFGRLVDALGVTGATFLSALDGGPALAHLTSQALAARRR